MRVAASRSIDRRARQSGKPCISSCYQPVPEPITTYVVSVRRLHDGILVAACVGEAQNFLGNVLPSSARATVGGLRFNLDIALDKRPSVWIPITIGTSSDGAACDAWGVGSASTRSRER